MPEPTVGFIGLGKMGMPMATRLVQGGHTVRGFDVSESARDALAAIGGLAVGSPPAAAESADVVVLMLPDSSVVDAVVTDEAFLAALAPGAVVVDMSSSEPLCTQALQGPVTGRGAVLIDAPVSGGVTRAVSGELAIMVGGDPADVDRVRPLLSELGVIHLAGPLGAGHAVKALNNLMSATHLLVSSEAILAGQRFGLDVDVMLGIFNSSSGRSGSTENKWPNFIVPQTYNSGFGLRLMLKDMRIATALAEQVGAPSRLGADAVAVWERAAAATEPGADHTEIARWLHDHVTD